MSNRPVTLSRVGVLILLATAFLATCAFAFGSVAQNEVSAVASGSTSFSLLFWDDNETVELWIEDAPLAWTVAIEPLTLTLNRDTGQEYIAVGTEYMRASVVNVHVTPQQAKGSGSVIVGARSRHSGPGLTFFQERYFNLTVKVDPEEKIAQRLFQDLIGSINTITGRLVANQGSMIFGLFVVILLAVILMVAKAYREYRTFYPRENA